MVHTFKIYGQYYALDIASKAVHLISPAEYDILRYIKLPFENELPSSLRYDLAKYSSDELSASYLRLSKLSSDGVLMPESFDSSNSGAGVAFDENLSEVPRQKKDSNGNTTFQKTECTQLTDNQKALSNSEKNIAGCANTVVYSKNSPVFASKVLKLADSGVTLISAEQDLTAPVSPDDYDIVCSEYERIAKEMIKRKTGRAAGPDFGFLPFDIPSLTDKLGYLHIGCEISPSLFTDKQNAIKAKITECACSLLLT